MSFVRGIGLTLALISGACKAYDPKSTDDTLASCCGGLGGCVPGGLVPSAVREALAVDSCGNAELCVPGAFLEDPSAAPVACRAVGDLEGRCLPHCLPQIADRADELKRQSCREGELCAPCYDPRTGKDTGACRLSSDPGPAERPRRFEPCCDARGSCVPRELLSQNVTSADLKRLGPAGCTTPDALCTPKIWLSDSEHAPATCQLPGKREGRCLPDCLPDVVRQADSLKRRECEEGELCVPCYDPLKGDDTGACRTGRDRPADPPRTFAACCDGSGRCVPREFLESVESSDLAHLDRSECSERNTLCVPNAWLRSERLAPAACRALGDLDGRCLPSCLPEIAARGGSLMQQSCETSERCVPCYDPRTGEDSGACRLAGDEPQEPPRTFDRCCGDRGRCVPLELAEQSATQSALARVGAGECASSDLLCIPETWLDGEPPPPAICRAPGDLEGRCILACLPDVQARLDSLVQASCDADERCVPCFDPRTAEASGACTMGVDQPSEPPRTFADCCGDLGSCVPSEILSQLEGGPVQMLGPDTCTESEGLCVMKRWLDLERSTTCRAPGDFEGRCVPACLPSVAAQLETLRKSTCAEPERCVPCFDPTNGADTGVCRIAGDEPTEPSRGFDACCGMAGRCLPADLLPSEQLDAIPAGGCATETDRCVPAPLVTSASRFTACTSSRQPGLCIAECFLPSDTLGLLSRANCSSTERCVSCSRLPAGLGAECP